MADSGAKTNGRREGEVTLSEMTSNGPALRCQLSASGQKAHGAVQLPHIQPRPWVFFQASTELLSNWRQIPGSGSAVCGTTGDLGRPQRESSGIHSSLSAAAFFSTMAAIFQLFLHRVFTPRFSHFFFFFVKYYQLI